MSFTSEFPHTDFYNSDLRELIAMYRQLVKDYNSIKAEIDEAVETIRNFDSIIDAKIKDAITGNLLAMQTQMDYFNRKVTELEVAFMELKSDTQDDINFILARIAELERMFTQEYSNIRLEMNRLLETFAEYKESIDGIVQAKINDALEQIKESVEKLDRLEVTNPFNGVRTDIQLVLNEICQYLVYGFGLTAQEYDGMELKAIEYDNLMLSASAYSMKGFFMFFEHFYMRMRSPFTGLMDTYANIINKLVSFHKKGITAEMYDSLNFTAEGYDLQGIDAYHYDWNGEVIAVTT